MVPNSCGHNGVLSAQTPVGCSINSPMLERRKLRFRETHHLPKDTSKVRGTEASCSPRLGPGNGPGSFPGPQDGNQVFPSLCLNIGLSHDTHGVSSFDISPPCLQPPTQTPAGSLSDFWALLAVLNPAQVNLIKCRFPRSVCEVLSRYKFE